jgi:hypothetical protein
MRAQGQRARYDEEVTSGPMLRDGKVSEQYKRQDALTVYSLVPQQTSVSVLFQRLRRELLYLTVMLTPALTKT